MKLLALETSGLSGELALLDDGVVVADVALDANVRTARALAPGIQSIVSEAGWRMRDLHAIAVSIGPGSFTGLRIGVTTAKTLAYALQAEVLAIHTLEVIAAQTPLASAGQRLWTVIDAQRGELFAARFVAQAAETAMDWHMAAEAVILSPADVIMRLQSGDWLTGGGLKRLADQLPAGVQAVEPSHWTTRASTVGRLAWRDWLAGRRDDFWKLSPVYYRPSAAEEKQERQASGERLQQRPQ
jgi:tRNA threonylcarbamoyladenosine biosynthesis protein TsaB